MNAPLRTELPRSACAAIRCTSAVIAVFAIRTLKACEQTGSLGTVVARVAAYAVIEGVHSCGRVVTADWTVSRPTCALGAVLASLTECGSMDGGASAWAVEAFLARKTVILASHWLELASRASCLDSLHTLIAFLARGWVPVGSIS